MMKHKTILCCTQNDAMMVQRKLMHCGIPSRTVKPPRENMSRSCSWGVEMEREYARRAEGCLKQIPIRWQWMEEGMQ